MSRVVENLSLEKRALIIGAAQEGFKVTGKQIDRYRLERLLPPAARVGRGKGMGVGRSSVPGTIEQLVALCRLLKEDRSFDRAAVHLWLDGYAVPTDRVRLALRRKVVEPVLRLIEAPNEALDAQALRVEQHLVERHSMPKRIRKLARKGELAEVFSGMLRFMKPGGLTGADHHLAKFAKDFERAASLDQAREGLSKINIGAWLSGDTTETMGNLLESMPTFLTIADATDQELLVAKDTYFDLELIQQWARLMQQHFGEDALGLRLLTSDVLGKEIRVKDPRSLADVIFLIRVCPEAITQFKSVSCAIRQGFEQVAALQRGQVPKEQS